MDIIHALLNFCDGKSHEGSAKLRVDVYVVVRLNKL